MTQEIVIPPEQMRRLQELNKSQDLRAPFTKMQIQLSDLIGQTNQIALTSSNQRIDTVWTQVVNYNKTNGIASGTNWTNGIGADASAREIEHAGTLGQVGTW